MNRLLGKGEHEGGACGYKRATKVIFVVMATSGHGGGYINLHI